MISFVVQNETHASNFLPLCVELEAQGVPREQIEMLHLDPATGLSTVPSSSRWSRELRLPRSTPFYLLSSLERLRYLWRADALLMEEMERTKVLVIGNDGALQRRMARRVKHRGGTVFMLVDGLLLPPSPKPKARLRLSLKRLIYFVAHAVGLDHLVPTEVGFLPVEKIFVMDESVKRALTALPTPSPVEVVTLPRVEEQRATFLRLRERTSPDELAVTYITSAFRWHGLTALDEAQRQDLADLYRFAAAHPELAFRIRIHPREDVSWYEECASLPNVELSDASVPLPHDLAMTSVLVTARSTVALEAVQYGLPAIIYGKNFGPPPPNSFFSDHPALIHSEDLATVLSARNLARGPLDHPGVVAPGISYLARCFATALHALEESAQKTHKHHDPA